MPHNKEVLLKDILIAIDDVEEFSEGKTLGDFQADKLLQAGVERKIEIIGEALNRLKALDANLLQRITNSHRIIGMRNIIAHGYDVIDQRIIWEVVRSHLRVLREDVERLQDL